MQSKILFSCSLSEAWHFCEKGLSISSIALMNGKRYGLGFTGVQQHLLLGIIIWGFLCFSSSSALSLFLFTVHTYTNCVIHCNDKARTECLAFILVLDVKLTA